MIETSLRPYVRYDSPAGGQPVRPKNPYGAWSAMTHFLTTCTDWTNPEGTDWSLTIFEPGEHMPRDWDHRPVVADSETILGPGSRSVGISSMDASSATFKHEWKVPAEQFPACLELLSRLPALSTKDVHPVSISTTYFDLRLRDPRTCDLLAGQDAPGEQPLRSSVFIHLSAASSVGFDLMFPFREPGAELRDYLAAIRPYLPVAKVAYNCFRHYLPNKAGSGHAIRKVPPALFAGLK